VGRLCPEDKSMSSNPCSSAPKWLSNAAFERQLPLTFHNGAWGGGGGESLISQIECVLN